jgi:ribosomal protein S18 acetylase RimI-like enzyme
MTTHDPELTIRPRADADLPALATVLAEVHERDGYPVLGEHVSVDWLQSGQLIQAWVAAIGDDPVGHVALNQLPAGDGDLARLWRDATGVDGDAIAVLGRLFVGAQARGQRLGRRLTEVATAGARELGRRPVLEVMAKDTAAIHTYESLGWQRVGEISHAFSNGRTEPAFVYVSPSIGRPHYSSG